MRNASSDHYLNNRCGGGGGERRRALSNNCAGGPRPAGRHPAGPRSRSTINAPPPRRRYHPRLCRRPARVCLRVRVRAVWRGAEWPRDSAGVLALIPHGREGGDKRRGWPGRGPLGVAGRQNVATPAGSRVAKKMTGLLFESKNHRLHRNIGL